MRSHPGCTVAPEHVDPFDTTNPHLWVKLEHVGRYCFAADLLKARAPGVHLDLGCATGYGLGMLAEFTSRATGVDYDAALLQAAARDDVELILGDLDLEPLADLLAPILSHTLLDSVTAFECLEHLHDPARAVRQMRACMRDGALLIASVPNARYEAVISTNTHHRTVFGPGEFAALLSASDFVVEQTLGQGTVNRINRRETHLVRKGHFDERPSALPGLHSEDSIRKLARVLAYPETHDLEFTYSHVFVARAVASRPSP